MPIFPNDSNDDKYTGPESISPKCKKCWEFIKKYNLTPDELHILICREQGDTWENIAIRKSISRWTAQRIFRKAMRKAKRFADALIKK